MTFQSLLRPFLRSFMRFAGIRKIDPFERISFSQEGEDLILARFLEPRTTGFYIDIGAHHPRRFSNTCYFYQRGWRGINIDPMPGSMDEFNRKRPDDINLELAVSDRECERTYYVFNDTALNTFDDTLATEREKLSRYHIVDTTNVKCRRLDSILSEYLPENQHIDFMTIDAEGLDAEILRSNDWQRYRPDYLIVECLDTRAMNLRGNPIIEFLAGKGYSPVAMCFNSVILCDASKTGNA